MERRTFLQTSTIAASGLLAGAPAQAAKNPNIKWGIYTRPWWEEDWQDQLDAISRAGFTNVGLMRGGPDRREPVRIDRAESDTEQLRKWLSDRDMQVVSAYFAPDLNKTAKEAIGETEDKVRGYASLGMDFLLIGGTGKPDQVPVFYEAMQHLADLTEELGMECHVKPHGGITPDGASTAAVVKKINRKNVKLSYDPGNMIYYEGLDPVAELKPCLDLTASMCVKDCIRHSKEDRNVNVTPGDGMVDFQGVFDLLLGAGFSGHCVIETLGGTTLRENIREAHRAMKFLQQFGSWER
jgi:sugar phosphate isomerase/epimerase